MKQYQVNWKVIDDEDFGVLLDAVARYASNTECLDVNVIFSILAINEVEEKNEVIRN